jgi:hypothetical protein
MTKLARVFFAPGYTVPDPAKPDGCHKADFRLTSGYELDRSSDGVVTIKSGGRTVQTSFPCSWEPLEVPVVGKQASKGGGSK